MGLLIYFMLNSGILTLLCSTKSMLFGGDLRVMKIFYLTEANVKHLQTCKLNITMPYLGWKEGEGQKGPLLVSLNTF